MAASELLHTLEIDGNVTVETFYRSVAWLVNETIDGISEPMRKSVLHVRTIRRGPSLEIQRTKVRVGGLPYLPFTQNTLLTRWGEVGSRSNATDAPKGVLATTHKMIAEKHKMSQYYGQQVKVKGENNPDLSEGKRHTAAFDPTLIVDLLEPNRRDLLFAVAESLVSHAVAVQQINDGVDPSLVLTRLHSPDAGLATVNG